MTMPQRRYRTARLCGAGAILIGLSGLFGWITARAIFNSIVPGYKPIAITASVLSLLLGGVLLLMARERLARSLAGILLVITAIVAIFTLLEIFLLLTGINLTIEDAILQRFPALFQNPDVHISPVASTLMFVIAVALLLLLWPRRYDKSVSIRLEAAGLLGALAIISAFVFFLGFVFRTPLLTGTQYLPIAWLATTTIILLGIGVIALAGEAALPLRVVVGLSTRARLLRAFLPLIALLLLLSNAALYFLSFLIRVNPALVAGISTVVFLVVTTLVILRVAAVLGGMIDQAEVDRRAAMVALAASEELFRTVFNSVYDAIILHDADGRIVTANDSMVALYGVAPDEITRLSIADLSAAEMPLETLPARWRAVLAGETAFFPWRARRPHTGELFDVEVFLRKLTLEDRDVVMANVRDITERKQAEAERERLLQEVRDWADTLETRVEERTAALQAANKELEAFSYSVSHDLRAPLRSIDGFSKVLLERYSELLDERGRDYLDRIRAAAQRMGQLIDDLLGLSRIGRREMRRETVNLSSLATEILTELHEREPDRIVETVITPDAVAEGDPELLRIVLTNLLGNAWKFTREREITRIEFGVSVRDHQRAYFIRDNGAGFDMAYVDKLFSPFQRLHTETEFPGTGIGLAIVQRIIHRHGGMVWAESAVGEGATFTFTLGG
ncbi:MAG: Phytochrome-like protein cph1 [bacterium ADurb.Bin429]|nr:MAG: Phytochrome-like protein cph1 [bacterium ADurb.Bin429]